ESATSGACPWGPTPRDAPPEPSRAASAAARPESWDAAWLRSGADRSDAAAGSAAAARWDAPGAGSGCRTRPAPAEPRPPYPPPERREQGSKPERERGPG